MRDKAYIPMSSDKLSQYAAPSRSAEEEKPIRLPENYCVYNPYTKRVELVMDERVIQNLGRTKLATLDKHFNYDHKRKRYVSFKRTPYTKSAWHIAMLVLNLPKVQASDEALLVYGTYEGEW